MKKLMYSRGAKLSAAALHVISVVMVVILGLNFVLEFDDSSCIYMFERDFSESKYISYLLTEPENMLFNAYYNTLYSYDEEGNPDGNIENLEENIKYWFAGFNDTDKVSYFIQWNDLTLTNCNAETAEEVKKGEYYSYTKLDSSGKIEYESSGRNSDINGRLIEEITEMDDESTIVISCNINDEAAAKIKKDWEYQKGFIINTGVQALICRAVSLVMFIYLVFVCGRDKNGELKNTWADNIWLEIHLLVMMFAVVLTIELCWFIISEYMSGIFPYNMLVYVIGAMFAICDIIILASLLSFVRNIKAGRLLKTSIFVLAIKKCRSMSVAIVKWIWRSIKDFIKTVYLMLSKKTGILIITSLFIYTSVIGLFGMGAVWAPIWIVLGIVLFRIFSCFIAGYAGDIDEIKKGVHEVRSGNVSYKISGLKYADMKILADDINDIAKGLDESVAAKVRAERLKSELVTNVSHDLKTPITSIISYTELLSKTEGLPEEAKDYIAVLAKKSDSLKRLTQDLFDISRVQSGNENVTMEKLDVSLLISQSMGENDNEIKNSGLFFCVSALKELYIYADGGKMSRVLNNLISNALKYAMKGTRVFITALEKDGSVEIEMKNISAYPLDFTVEEITQRFVRGDESRTTEGNGLGLAIAKSYTEICNGKFDIVIDGDMFKVILAFEKYE